MACPQGSSGQNILYFRIHPILLVLGWGLVEHSLDKGSCVCWENGARGGYQNEVSICRVQE